MGLDHTENERRKSAALAAIKKVFASHDDNEVGIFVSHHLAEIDETYWVKHLGTRRPEAAQVLDLLELRSHWGKVAEDGGETFDFTLPEHATDYVIAVKFCSDGKVGEISMES